MHLFHVPYLDGDIVDLPENEAHHALNVLRLAAGQRVGLLDGRGTRADAELMPTGKHRCTARIVGIHRYGPERSATIHLAVAPTKHNDRFEWFIEKAVEVGVDRITPLRTARTERSSLRQDRLVGVAVAAMKQSRRTWLPEIAPYTRLDDLLHGPLPPQRFFGWCAGTHEPLMSAYAPVEHALVVIGPEGDLSPDEAHLLRAAGFLAVSLGAARLRTETAALAACTWMSLAQQR